jgi:hypothetical protein
MERVTLQGARAFTSPATTALLPPVLTGHASSLPSYLLDMPRPRSTVPRPPTREPPLPGTSRLARRSRAPRRSTRQRRAAAAPGRSASRSARRTRCGRAPNPLSPRKRGQSGPRAAEKVERCASDLYPGRGWGLSRGVRAAGAARAASGAAGGGAAHKARAGRADPGRGGRGAHDRDRHRGASPPRPTAHPPRLPFRLLRTRAAPLVLSSWFDGVVKSLTPRCTDV